jgi:hypothetical protein
MVEVGDRGIRSAPSVFGGAPVAFLLLVVLPMGCASVASMQGVLKERRKGKGITATYPVAATNIWSAIDVAINWSGVGRSEDRRGDGSLLVSFEGGLIGHPTIFSGIWVEPETNDYSRVTVIVQTKVYTPVFTEEQFHRDLAAIVGLMVEGKPLPLVRPD